jgi:hypothetical protein
MLDVIKEYKHHDFVITVAQVEQSIALDAHNGTNEDWQDICDEAYANGPVTFFLVSSGKADASEAADVTVYGSKQKALNAAEDEYNLHLTWDKDSDSILLEQDEDVL